MLQNIQYVFGHPALPGGLFRVIGNPLNDGTWSYTWSNGRQLTRMTSVDKDVRFVYNENGLRVQKRVDGVATNYYLHGKNVVHMTRGIDELHFFYDAQNKPAVVVYNGTAYAYLKNLQGDIVAILNGSGTAVVSYVYDAWGRPISKTGSMASTLGTLNPFRYRSYVYDEETGLYYLRSRYYRPEQCRFLNADSLLTPNLFCHCNNNPIIAVDPDGHDAFWITDSTAVFSAGHTSLLLYDPNDSSWYYFYWGSRTYTVSSTAAVKVAKVNIEVINGTYLNLDSLNDALIDIEGKRGNYDSAFYFPGNFSASLAYARQLENDFNEIKDVINKSNEEAYHIIARNCMQVSADVMRQSYVNQADRDILNALAQSILPNLACELLDKYSTLPRTKYNIFGEMVFEY